MDLVDTADWIGLPAVVVGELWVGFLAGTRLEQNIAALRGFLADPSVHEIPAELPDDPPDHLRDGLGRLGGEDEPRLHRTGLDPEHDEVARGTAEKTRCRDGLDDPELVERHPGARLRRHFPEGPPEDGSRRDAGVVRVDHDYPRAIGHHVDEVRAPRPSIDDIHAIRKLLPPERLDGAHAHPLIPEEDVPDSEDEGGQGRPHGHSGNARQSRSSGVGSVPQPGNGAGIDAPPRKRWFRTDTPSEMSTDPSSFESAAETHPGRAAPRKR